MPRVDSGTLYGTLNLLILRTLETGPHHGLDVARKIGSVSKDTLRIEEGALYTALHRMEKRGWLDSDWGLSENKRKAKFYSLSPSGRNHLSKGTQTWSRYAEAVFKVLGSPEAEMVP